nr:hypothetical protein GCM10023233_10560 [Brevibacterium otitidis]
MMNTRPSTHSDNEIAPQVSRRISTVTKLLICLVGSTIATAILVVTVPLIYIGFTVPTPVVIAGAIVHAVTTWLILEAATRMKSYRT